MAARPRHGRRHGRPLPPTGDAGRTAQTRPSDSPTAQTVRKNDFALADARPRTHPPTRARSACPQMAVPSFQVPQFPSLRPQARQRSSSDADAEPRRPRTSPGVPPVLACVRVHLRQCPISHSAPVSAYGIGMPPCPCRRPRDSERSAFALDLH
ncbi:hypothetical protein C2E23DRAFT_92431 [Lenzites betulinus]|nr:hypothetical protein C2E23DRAFT_92431 [Lenzites betulinus]